MPDRWRGSPPAVPADAPTRTARTGAAPAGAPWYDPYVIAAAGILLVSILLRASLVLSGGQYYWPDEQRYETSRRAANALWHANFRALLDAFNEPDHLGFRVIGVVPAAVERATAPSLKIPALFFSGFSVAVLWLLWALLRRLGESRRVAFLGVAALASSSTLFYYSRHLLPYDAGMALALWSLYVGLRRPSRFADSLLCGVLACSAFLTYSAYSVLAAFALMAHCLQSLDDLQEATRRAAVSGAAFSLPIVALFSTNAALGGDLLERLLVFSRSARQGLYSEGWRLPFAYFWHAEHAITLLWGASAAWAAWMVLRGNRRPSLILGLAGCLSIYGCLITCSVGLQWFVVYGRMARQVVPFCGALVALFLDWLWALGGRQRVVAAGVGMLMVVQGAANFVTPLRQVFPDEFRRQALRAYPRSEERAYAIVNAEHIYPYPSAPLVHGRTILESPHPLSFLPYQYEGYTPEQRTRLRSTDLRMRLVLTSVEGP